MEGPWPAAWQGLCEVGVSATVWSPSCGDQPTSALPHPRTNAVGSNRLGRRRAESPSPAAPNARRRLRVGWAAAATAPSAPPQPRTNARGQAGVEGEASPGPARSERDPANASRAELSQTGPKIVPPPRRDPADEAVGLDGRPMRPQRQLHHDHERTPWFNQGWGRRRGKPPGVRPLRTRPGRREPS
jgi:hypothetical protein